ncbi:hypothetical protein LJR219_004204 [Phenylobacterium sp. LjRoot219]|uniref:hypothetical protein n=1 Tax=Phenylobacterium sp. LjRoot219 TaxID=3342283 RepID=UPI003ECF7FED
MSLSAWLRGAFPTEAEVRAEIWSLGARHLGSPLEGARGELKSPDLPRERAQLLRACVRELERH